MLQEIVNDSILNKEEIKYCLNLASLEKASRDINTAHIGKNKSRKIMGAQSIWFLNS